MKKTTTLDLADPLFKADPYPTYARLRQEHPVYRTTLGRKQPAWLLTRYDDVAAALRDERLVKNPRTVQSEEQRKKEPWMPAFIRPLTRNMLDLDAAEHSRLRALVQKAFTPRLVGRLAPRIESLTDERLSRAGRAGRIELVGEYALPIPLTIISELLGVPLEDQQRFHRWTSRIVSVSTSSEMALAVPAIWSLLRYLRRLVALRRADPQDDLVTALVQAEESGDTLDEDEVLGMIFLLLAAGHETTVNLIASGALALAQHPEQREMLIADRSLMKPAVEELARFTSPVELATQRYAREEITIAGVTIPRGGLVLAAIGSANRDESQFDDPDRLDLMRASNRHLAYGLGAHYCLGAPLARLEAGIAFGALLDRWPCLRLEVDPATLRWCRNAFLRGLRALPMVFDAEARIAVRTREIAVTGS